MENIISKAKTGIYKASVFCTNPVRRAKWCNMANAMRLIMVAQLLICISGQLVFADTSAKALTTNLISVMISIFKYVGIALIVWGVIQFLLAVKKSDAESKSEAITTAIVGIALIGLGTVVGKLGLDLDTVENNKLDS